MQLQHSAAQDPDLAVYALSYDPVDTLATFAQAHEITYPLLGDVGSVALEELGLLNTTIDGERKAWGRSWQDRYERLPYPVTILLDADGVVVERVFERSHRVRPTPANLLSRLFDDRPPAVSDEASSPGVAVAAWLESDTVTGNQIQDLHVRLDLDDDVHVYVDDVPDGFTALGVSVSGDDDLRTRPFAIPEGHPFVVEGLDEQFSVLDGSIELRIPLYVFVQRDTAGDPTRSIDVTVAVSYQACTSDTCHAPAAIELHLPITEMGNPVYENQQASSIKPLVLRRLAEQPLDRVQLQAKVSEGTLDPVPQAYVDELVDTLLGEDLLVDNDGLLSPR